MGIDDIRVAMTEPGTEPTARLIEVDGKRIAVITLPRAVEIDEEALMGRVGDQITIAMSEIVAQVNQSVSDQLQPIKDYRRVVEIKQRGKLVGEPRSYGWDERITIDVDFLLNPKE